MLARIPVDLTVPSLPALSYVLRHREHWPAGFVFDYHSCCAMDLAYRLWQVDPCVAPVAATLGMSAKEAYRIFICGGGRGGWSGRYPCDIAPEHVADQIDRYLANKTDS